MARVTFFVVQVFEESEEGLIAAPEIFCASREDAVTRGKICHAYTGLGVRAWERTGDTQTGEWYTAPVVFFEVGRIPPDAIEPWA
jgi:hypothetical protein